MAITRDEAARIALAHLTRASIETTPIVANAPRAYREPAIGEVRSLDEIPRPPMLYGLQHMLTDCWIAYVARTATGFRSSEIVVVSRQSGEILYHGSAHDEG